MIACMAEDKPGESRRDWAMAAAALRADRSDGAEERGPSGRR
jgi:hypothetical protein